MAHWIVSPNRMHWLHLISRYSFTIYTGLGVYTTIISPTMDNTDYIFVSKPLYMALTPCTDW